MKKIRDKPNGVIIYTWKYHKETPFVATFTSNKLKCHGFHFIFSPFFFNKIREQESGTSPTQG
jgi:hypothetical protein